MAASVRCLHMQRLAYSPVGLVASYTLVAMAQLQAVVVADRIVSGPLITSRLLYSRMFEGHESPSGRLT